MHTPEAWDMADPKCPDCKGTGEVIERTVPRVHGPDKILSSTCLCVHDALALELAQEA